MGDRKASLSQYPLSWPDGWRRTSQFNRKPGRFRASLIVAVERILEQLRMMGIKRDDVLISTNVPTRLDGLPRSDQRNPSDPGAALYWREWKQHPEMRP